MTSGDLTMEEATRLQTFTGVLRCDSADNYEPASGPPTCLPICEVCALRWIKFDPRSTERGGTNR